MAYLTHVRISDACRVPGPNRRDEWPLTSASGFYHAADIYTPAATRPTPPATSRRINAFDEQKVNLISLFRSDRSAAISLTGKEIAVLEAVKRNEATGVCAADIQRILSVELGKEARLATLYGAISDLERKNLIEESGFSPPDQGGRPRRLFKLTENGRLAHALGEAMAGSALSFAPA